ncbi:hypothetical protein LIPSTDRAFT_7153 [Lipomyces starkeyi NRRL Y-11557]|uniref:HAT C-terminal dimerisation domain-containing protein n=1 Tax=Lipomyces starkeyi NRRL Y-11557 TaxID=675824 RepID=A0A1E3PUQ7_LIPST|nr:hypothetical protein LIPSTDRAFT_7153 [Lipomyces starkeyi NRRL Y-11557]
MTSQASDILSQLDGELFEIPDSPIDQLQSSLSQAMSTATATKPKRYSKVWLHTPVGRKDVILKKKGKSIGAAKRHNVNISSARAEKKKASSLEQDEYTKYLLAPVLPEVTDPKSWLLEPTQRKSYPALSIMALDVLSIPAMSAEPERLSSSAKITITDRRNRLGIDTIEAIECLKSWLGKDGTVAFADSAVDMSSSDSNEERI